MSQPDPRKVAELLGQGLTLTEIAHQLEGPDDGASADERAAANARVAFNGGGTPPGQEPAGPPAPQKMVETFHRARAGGASMEQAQALGLGVLMEGAINGDPYAVHDQNRWKLQMAERQGDVAATVERNRQARAGAQAEYEAARSAYFLGRT